MKKSLFIILLNSFLLQSQTINQIHSIPVKLVFDGNSLFNLGGAPSSYILFGFSVSNRTRVDFIGNIKAPVISDYSIQGKTIAQLITDFPTKIQPYVNKNDIIVFWELVNSLRTGSTPAQALTDLKSYCALAKQYVSKVYVLTCAPDGKLGFSNSDRLTLNALILSDPSFCDGVIDICQRPEFDNVSDALNTTYYNVDSLHHTQAGSNVIGDYIYNYFLPLFTYNNIRQIDFYIREEYEYLKAA